MKTIFNNFIGAILFTLVIATPQLVSAASFSVSPLIFDVNAVARDSFVHTLTLTSHDSRPQRLFASVHEISVGDDSEIKSFVPASMSDRSIAVTSWIEITRGRIDLTPGEVTEIPLTIRINHNTPPGLYHAFVGFAQGANRDEADAKVMSGQGAGVVLRISVGGKQEAFLKLVSFTTDRFSLFADKGLITYTLENTGDVPLAPTGDVIIYDSRGKELSVIELDGDHTKEILPGEKLTFTKDLPFINRLGKNKAFLSLEYGKDQRAALYDTNFYYSIPWFYLVAIMVLLLIVLVGLLLLFKRGSTSSEYYEHVDVHDVPLFVGKVREHSEYEHDINLKKKDL